MAEIIKEGDKSQQGDAEKRGAEKARMDVAADLKRIAYEEENRATDMEELIAVLEHGSTLKGQ